MKIPSQPLLELLATDPDYLIVLPWHFRAYFLAAEKFKGRTLVFPLPQLDVVHC